MAFWSTLTHWLGGKSEIIAHGGEASDAVSCKALKRGESAAGSASAPVGQSHGFEYEPLSEPTRQIRLLRFRDRRESEHSGEEVIHLEMETRDINSANYYAISYTWGEPITKDISVNGTVIKVRQNCHYALWQAQRWLARKTFGGYIWIDSICIDQNNEQEKTYQVSIMHRIFSYSRHVLVCIGEHADGSEALLRANASRSEYGETTEYYWLVPQDRRSDTLRLCRERFDSLAAFFSRRYWYRLWVVQELAAGSGKSTVLCGELVVPIQECLKLVRSLELPDHVLLQLKLVVSEEGFRAAVYAARHVQDLLTSNKLGAMDFDDALIRTAVCECSDVRDYVYGILSLTYSTVVPDYTKSRIEVALEAIARSSDLNAITGLLRKMVLSPKDADSLIANESRLQEDAHPALRAESEYYIHDMSVMLAYRQISCHSITQAISTPFRGDETDLRIENIVETAGSFWNSFRGVTYQSPNLTTTPATSGQDAKPSYRRLVTRLRHVGYICADARPGDVVLVGAALLNNANCFLVLRHVFVEVDDGWPSLSVYDVVGNGFLSDGFSFKRSTKEGRWIVFALMQLTVMDIMLLAAHGTEGSTKVDVTYLRTRLSTNLSKSPKRAVVWDYYCARPDHIARATMALEKKA